MTRQAKVIVAVVAVFAAAVVGLIALAPNTTGTGPTGSTDSGTGSGTGTSGAAGGEAPAVVRADGRVLGERADTDVTFTEFLDFECEGCRAAYPAIEQLRQEYAGRVTFVVRYFPLPSHFNAERAARAVEAAAQQDQFEAMYSLMYETQETWGEQRVPLDDLFRQFASDIGLDMTQFDADYNAPATAARVQADLDEGVALDVTGTPTFFINDQRVEPRTYTDLTDALDAALAE